jgi:hypothetical protein
MRILRARRTAAFVYFLVRCRCGKKFGQRAQRRLIVCYHCGRVAETAMARRAGSSARRSDPAGRVGVGRAASDPASEVGRRPSWAGRVPEARPGIPFAP